MASSRAAGTDVRTTGPLELPLLKVKRHRQRPSLKLAVRPPGFENKPTAPPGPQGSSLVGPDTRFSPSSRRRFPPIQSKTTVDASRMDLWLMSSSDRMGGGGDTASKDRTGMGEEKSSKVQSLISDIEGDRAGSEGDTRWDVAERSGS